MANKKNKAAEKKRRPRLAPVRREHKSVTKVRNEEVILKLAIAFRAFIVILVTTIVVLVVIAWVYDRWQETLAPIPQTVVEVESLLAPDEAIDEEKLAKFWNETIVPILQPLMWEFHHPVPEINDRLKLVKSFAESRWRQSVGFNVVLGYQPGSPGAPAAANISDTGQPMVQFFVARIKDDYEWFTKPGGEGSMAFANEIVVAFEHEVEHLAFSPYGQTNSTYDEFVAEEAKIHHNSCKYMIGPMMESDMISISSELVEIYRVWSNAGQKPKSPAWLAYCRHRYPRELVKRN